MARTVDIRRQRLKTSGQVQGVGFRPFVYRLATELELTGWVVNDANGVTIEAQGPQDRLAELARRLAAELPPLAEIARLEQSPAEPVAGEDGFVIRPSGLGGLADAQVTVDTATCDDCLREMLDPNDPRYEYPFINCTNCGPRYTILREIPYDRPNTTMAQFDMCPLCSRQYADPADRRFHAQPVACPACGPHVWLVDAAGQQIDCDDPIAEAARRLLAGEILAIKGLGGFHLACRADRDSAVARLRERKGREAKPFALMVADLDQAQRLCELDDEAGRLLTGPLKPIVLLPAAQGAAVAPSVAEGLDTLGIMLPYTPLHSLLMRQLGDTPLVMTSGNYSDEPLVADNEAAIRSLGRIADAMLLNDRQIAHSLDDSVVQMTPPANTTGHAREWSATIVRRARGYAPRPIGLSLDDADIADSPAVLAVGAELKNTVCLCRGGRAVISPHIGDLKDGRVYRYFVETIERLEKLFEFTPEMLAVDMHPQYLSTSYATWRQNNAKPPRPEMAVVRVQHHHAHIASCMAENGRTEPVIGLACDGVGYGTDGAVWGGEVLRADLRCFERLGHLRYIPLIGGDAAARQTYRPATAALYDTLGQECIELLVGGPGLAERRHVEMAVEQLVRDVNCPPTSSLGRWFDAVAALCGIAQSNRFEGEAAMKLESAAAKGVQDRYEFELAGETPFQIDLRPMVEGLVGDLGGGVGADVVSAKFHNTVTSFLAAAARRAREQTGITAVALSGGCFANCYVSARLTAQLEADGFTVLTHRAVPCNDGGIALGQAVVACAARAPAKTADIDPSHAATAE